MFSGCRSTETTRRLRPGGTCSIFITPPPYPGYTSCLGSLNRNRHGQTIFASYGENISQQPVGSTSSNFYRRPATTTPDEGIFTSASCFKLSSPPLASPENDSEFQLDLDPPSKKTSQVASASSGYGSSSSESDQEISEQLSMKDAMSESTTSSTVFMRRRDRQSADKWRRRSVPASLRNAFTDDVMRVLQMDGHVIRVETDADTGKTLSMEIRGGRRPESVMQLARKFGEISAAQQNDVHRSRNSLMDGKENARATTIGQSRSGPCTPVKTVHTASERSTGGIASLKSTHQPRMATRTNMFKQMERVNSSSSPRIMNPNSIKEALLRWVQSRIHGYPNVNVTNFSSSWADGMAFCALIHRFAPDAFDFDKLDPKNRRQNFELAFRVAEEHGICPLLEVDDMIMMGDRPDWKCVFTYVQCFYKQFRDHP